MTTIAEVIEEMESKGIRVTGDEDKAVLAYLFLTRPDIKAEVTELVWQNRKNSRRNVEMADHDHGTDIWEASKCSAECLVRAKAAKRIYDAEMLETSKDDIDIGGGYTLRKPKRYIVKCDDCKTTIGQTDSLKESAEGGRCAPCKVTAQYQVWKATQPEPRGRYWTRI